jgi:hypothetical protein
MGKVLDYIKGILADGSGVPSSKRVISVIFSILIGAAFVANLGWGLTIDDNILDAVMIVVVAGLGITGIEKFAPRKQQNEVE